MKRRAFLKLLGAAASAPVLAKLARADSDRADSDYVSGEFHGPDCQEFDPSVQYGNFVMLNEDPATLSKIEREKVYEVLFADISEYIPSSHVHKVKFMEYGLGSGGESDPFAEAATIAWKYTP